MTQRTAWWTWLACCVATVSIQLVTLEFGAKISQDEIQILESGRTFWQPDSEWGISWNVQESMPVLTWSFLGSAIQEVAYWLSAPSNLGPRAMSVFSGLLAATSMLGWLLARRTNTLAALVISLAFLLDPIFNSVYRRGRIDGWAIAACLAACWFLRNAEKRSSHKRIYVYLAGQLAGLSPFFWATAPMLFPLILVECYYLAKTEIQIDRSLATSRVINLGLMFLLGGVSAGLLAAIPVLAHWDSYWAAFVTLVEIQSRAAVIQGSTLDLLLVYDPFVVVATIVALMIRREVPVLLAVVLAYLIMIRTMVYLPRVLYLLPYFAAMMAVAATAAYSLNHAPRRKTGIASILAVVLAWGIYTTLISQPFAALKQFPGNDPTIIYNAMQRTIGPGPYRVLLEEWEAYYAARQLGWSIYRAGSPVPREEYLDFARNMDFILIRAPENSIFPQLDISQLESAGFELQEEVVFARFQENGEDSEQVQVDTRASTYPNLLIFRKIK